MLAVRGQVIAGVEIPMVEVPEVKQPGIEHTDPETGMPGETDPEVKNPRVKIPGVEIDEGPGMEDPKGTGKAPENAGKTEPAAKPEAAAATGSSASQSGNPGVASGESKYRLITPALKASKGGSFKLAQPQALAGDYAGNAYAVRDTTVGVIYLWLLVNRDTDEGFLSIFDLRQPLNQTMPVFFVHGAKDPEGDSALFKDAGIPMEGLTLSANDESRLAGSFAFNGILTNTPYQGSFDIAFQPNVYSATTQAPQAPATPGFTITAPSDWAGTYEGGVECMYLGERYAYLRLCFEGAHAQHPQSERLRLLLNLEDIETGKSYDLEQDELVDFMCYINPKNADDDFVFHADSVTITSFSANGIAGSFTAINWFNGIELVGSFNTKSTPAPKPGTFKIEKPVALTTGEGCYTFTLGHNYIVSIFAAEEPKLSGMEMTPPSLYVINFLVPRSAELNQATALRAGNMNGFSFTMKSMSEPLLFLDWYRNPSVTMSEKSENRISGSYSGVRNRDSAEARGSFSATILH